jgi:prepilin-type N-terminal cleavage/methylation domain-containing protein/prepilin-type processing-associated H-X9-DG protein
MKTKRAFTLVELLVVVAIIAILALLVSVAAGSFQKKAQTAQSLANLKNLASGLMNHISSHDGEFPKLGVSEPAWGAADDKDRDAWYHAVPKAAGSRGLGEFDKPDAFYQKQNLLFLPIGQYPKNKTARPYFAVAINANLYGSADSRKNSENETSVRLSQLQMPSVTIVFLEVGLPDEDTVPGQDKGMFKGSAQGGPENVVARYNKTDSDDFELRREANINLVFGDGHVESLAAKDVLDTNGKAYHPQLQQNNGGGRVSWTLDPEANPSSN